jgi:hypothetical protein
VSDWVQEEEAKYSAHLLSRELDKMRHDEDLAAKAAEKAAKSKKSPRKSPSKYHLFIETRFCFCTTLGYETQLHTPEECSIVTCSSTYSHKISKMKFIYYS